MAPELTTTSFAILSLLAVRPWTAYELSRQMERSVGAMWSRAASVVYEEPKRLVDRGLARAERTFTGKRASTHYSITPRGRRELAGWLETAGAGPGLEFEGLLKVAFADQGSLEGLRTNLAGIRAVAEEQIRYDTERRAEYVQTGGPYPDRLPVISLASRYFREQAQALLRWVEWAEDVVSRWEGVTPSTGARVPDDAFD